ncbi:DExH-box ATP-dependent RNA helicase DExH1-like [Contarinia nasturtii]|uniref:DExH-box ATP-dependent RNA helicase DExH1-like n=1 Tax=Contarinia nasturtii TaxID=265458 RepID=UPI0012D3B7CB|nr:DExH-box ATP-dependent RNA helicase DExH1-like [Contarinia nasturtii]XP_031637054.1 DExH-box ATP-dependent RNA helicase DExH1-like [Contarinia nasturtii]XP_031637763.1 DExH-box ATP-dependent RNA helicase DExH1-like [Contarinia nasturtii]XP_031639961.1 DExH-box ATP-dependent RNA helicase DExH1-like [Contarinia nasturtii]
MIGKDTGASTLIISLANEALQFAENTEDAEALNPGRDLLDLVEMLTSNQSIAFENVLNQTDQTAVNAKIKVDFNFQKNILSAIPPIPPKNNDERHQQTRENLPIFKSRHQIIDTINRNQVVVISSQTGSGKTTQIPQYIMEDSLLRQQNCRIYCTQPRRLAATSIAKRVALERGEDIGHSIGYQIRMESCISPITNLIYTTSGYLLRYLIGSKKLVFKSITHLILDEVHEREKVTDFLMIFIRDVLKSNPHMKVILMSATLDSDIFCQYFGNCPVINVPGNVKLKPCTSVKFSSRPDTKPKKWLPT